MIQIHTRLKTKILKASQPKKEIIEGRWSLSVKEDWEEDVEEEEEEEEVKKNEGEEEEEEKEALVTNGCVYNFCLATEGREKTRLMGGERKGREGERKNMGREEKGGRGSGY